MVNYCYDKNSESCNKSSYLRDINLEILDFTVNTRILSQVAVMISVGRENHEMRGGGVLLSLLTGMVSGTILECSQEMRKEGELYPQCIPASCGRMEEDLSQDSDNIALYFRGQAGL